MLGDLSILKHDYKYSFRWLTHLSEPILPPAKYAFLLKAVCRHHIICFAEAGAIPYFHAFIASGFLL